MFKTSKVFYTDKKTPYLKSPGICLISKSQSYLHNVYYFLKEFNCGFSSYLDDEKIDQEEEIIKFAGQLCYMSFGEERTKNKNSDSYFKNLKKSGHGSVFEHSFYSFLFYGIDRAVTHELVRHRAGFAYSQVSQRYVDGKTLRFVERPEYQKNEDLHNDFVNRIDYAYKNYEETATKLLNYMDLKNLSKRDARKQVNQSARSVLPNEVEAPIVVTGNVRAWRHFIEMRANSHADSTIRDLAYHVCSILQTQSNGLFNDYVLDEETKTVSTEYKKI